MTVFIVNGAPKSGKDTFCQIVGKLAAPEQSIVLSSVDLVKEVATSLGWGGEKTLEDRKFLSDLKNLLTEWKDLPYQHTLHEMEEFQSRLVSQQLDPESSIIFIMVREPKEIERYCKELGAQSILVRRWEAEKQEVSNSADREVLNYNYDIEIWNDGDLEQLEETAREFLKRYS